MSRKLTVAAIAALPPLGLFAAIAAVRADLPPEQSAAFMALLSDRMPLIVLIGLFAAAIAGLIVWRLLAAQARACLQLADGVELASRPRLDTERAALPATAGAGPEIAVLTDRLERVLGSLEEARRDAAKHSELARADVERERNQFATLVAKLPQGVVACNRGGRVLLYNSRARDLIGSVLLGLGRPLSDVFDRRLLAHAEERILHGLSEAGASVFVSFVTSTAAGRLIRARISPVLAGGEEPAAERLTTYLILLDDVTREAEQAGKRDRLFDHLTQSQRAGLAAIQQAAEGLEGFDGLSQDQRQRVTAKIATEVARLTEQIKAVEPEVAELLRSATRLETMRGADLLASAARRIEAKTGLGVRIEQADQSLWLRVESFALVQVLVVLAQHLLEARELRELRLSFTANEGLAEIEIAWFGIGLSNETAAGWEIEPMTLTGGAISRSIREVLAEHQAELTWGRNTASARSHVRIRMHPSDPDESTAEVEVDDGRPEFYDFDLFKWSPVRVELADRPLADLAYTVFDTETTGLDPSGGDEIIQIGAVRIVNGRLLRGERFEQLVDPGRAIDPAAEAIHGIARVQLAGKPRIGEVLPGFHAFARDTVLVGHNAAFDMRFLQLKEAATGLRFDQPVLDTLLLSAVLHPNQETHRLDAIAERFGVPVEGRHDASGDALVTAQLFLRMLPLLAERGIRTLGEARVASEKTFHARIKY
jgi:DNA polymerase-3 subunit epsilon